MKESINRSILTNEKLRGVFKNNFKLVNQAIQLARFYIKSGHEIRMDRLLEELKNNPELNMELGAKYFAKMLKEKGSVEDALGAYNQGPNANWQSIPESQDYVKSIMEAYKGGTLPTW